MPLERSWKISDLVQISWRKLLVFSLLTLYEKQKTIFLLLFSDSFSIGLMFSNFFIEKYYKHYELGGSGRVSKKNYVCFVRGRGGQKHFVAKKLFVDQKHTCVYRRRRGETRGDERCWALYTLRRKWRFPLRISSVIGSKSAGNCGFGHIYWRSPSWKTSFFVQWYTS